MPMKFLERFQNADQKNVELSATFDTEGLFGEQTTKVTTPYDAYRRVALVRKCINILGQFTTRKGFYTLAEGPKPEVCKDIKRESDAANKRVNMDGILYTSCIKRQIFGQCGWEVVKDNDNRVTMLNPLSSGSIRPHVNETTQRIDYYDYMSEKFELNEMLFFSLDPLDKTKLGLSSIEPVTTTINLKLNLERDLLEASKRLWAPIGIFEMDLSKIFDPAERKKKIEEFKNKLKPGQSIIHTSSVKSSIIDMKPDLNGIIRGIEKADEEIMGNWGIPKALLSREKTLSKATLEYSLKALYEGPVEAEQRYFRRELEAQWYENILKSLKYDADTYSVKHKWKSITIYDPDLIRALATAVRYNAMVKEEMFDILGWEIMVPSIKIPEAPPEMISPSPPAPIEELPEFESIKEDIRNMQERLDKIESE